MSLVEMIYWTSIILLCHVVAVRLDDRLSLNFYLIYTLLLWSGYVIAGVIVSRLRLVIKNRGKRT